jgi:hypothetical protein
MDGLFAPILDFIAGRSAAAQVTEAPDLAGRAKAYLESAKDVPPLLAVTVKVLALAAEFDAEDGHTPEPALGGLNRPVSRGDRIRATVLAGLLGEEQPDPGDTL